MTANQKPTANQKHVCEESAKTIFLNAGGKAVAFERKAVEAAAVSTAATFHACIKSLTSDNAKATNAQKGTCSAKSKSAFQDSAGEEGEFAVAKWGGAQSFAAGTYSACIGGLSTASPSDVQKKACRESAKKAHEEAGGDTAVFERAQEDGARTEMMTAIEVCADAAILALGPGNDPTETQMKAIVTGCESGAIATFKKNGGDQIQFKAEKKKGIAEAVGKQLDACRKSKGTVDQACEQKAKTLMKSLGESEQRFDRLKQDGVRSEVAGLLEACRAEAATAADETNCDSSAKGKFKALTGKDDQAFESEKRKGAGQKAAALRKACMKNAADPAAQDACETKAKVAHTNAGGTTLDFWYDAKNGLQADSLDQYAACMDDANAADATCTAGAKKYFTVALKGDAGDWSDADFAESKQLKDSVVVPKPSPAVDIRFRFTPNAAESLPDKAALTTEKISIQSAIKAASSGEKCECNDATDAGTQLQLVCRVTASAASKAPAVESAARAGSYTQAVTTAIKSARRALRMLTVSTSTDSSVVQQASAETSSPTAAPTQAATSPDDDGSAAVAGNLAIGTAPGAFNWLVVLFAAAVHFRM